MEALSVPTALPRARVKRAVMPEPAHHVLSRSVAGLLGILLLLCSAVCLVLDFLREPLTKAWHAANTARACEEYYQQGDFDEALAACDAAIAASPTSAPAYITRGYIYMVRGNYQQALADFDSALTHDPDNGQAFINRGIVLERMGRFQSALDNYNDMLSRDISDSAYLYYGYNNRGVTYQNLGEIDLAIQDYIRAIEHRPDLPDAYKDLERLFLAQSNHDELLAINTQLVDKHPEAPDNLYHRGMIYRLTGKPGEAYADFQQCLESNPSELLKQQCGTQLSEIEPLVQR